jgi:hypothetical protein
MLSAHPKIEDVANVRLLVWQPLCCERWPLERASIEHVIEEDGVLLPYLVLLVDDLVLDLLLVLHLARVESVCVYMLALCHGSPTSQGDVLKARSQGES